MMIARNDIDDFLSVAEAYGMDSPAVDPGSGCMIIQDSSIAEDIMWAIRVVRGLELVFSHAISNVNEEKKAFAMPLELGKFA